MQWYTSFILGKKENQQKLVDMNSTMLHEGLLISSLEKNINEMIVT
jgi:hypothetical protein